MHKPNLIATESLLLLFRESQMPQVKSTSMPVAKISAANP
jgi:hypothetical protein